MPSTMNRLIVTVVSTTCMVLGSVGVASAEPGPGVVSPTPNPPVSTSGQSAGAQAAAGKVAVAPVTTTSLPPPADSGGANRGAIGGVTVGGPGSGIITAGKPPDTPGIQNLQANTHTVTIRWTDRSTNEDRFVLYRRDPHGAWQQIYQTPTRNRTAFGDNYSFTDADRTISGQCYMIAAAGANSSGYAPEQCTVRPDPGTFPQTSPQSVRQWSLPSNTNDGTGGLQSDIKGSNSSLVRQNQTFGVDLAWSEDTSLWRIEAQGGPHLMQGQAVALKVWGGGWLKYGNETWGVDVVLSDTPVYEWYALGGTPGTAIDYGQNQALWNSAANDYLVAGNQDWGVGLNWYKKTTASGGSVTAGDGNNIGVRTFTAYNCSDSHRALEMWTMDVTAGSNWVDKGQLDSQWANSGCPATGEPWTFNPTSGHKFIVESIDSQAPGCSESDAPTIGDCWRSQTTFVGDANGQAISTTIG